MSKETAEKNPFGTVNIGDFMNQIHERYSARELKERVDHLIKHPDEIEPGFEKDFALLCMVAAIENQSSN